MATSTNQKLKTYLQKRIAAFGFSFKGIADLLRNHPHAHLHAVATVVVLALAVFFPLGRWEWSVLLLSIGGVWTAEAMNTAIEYLTDLVSPAYHPLAGKTKDMASGAVLLMCIVAALVGIVVFYPHFRQYFYAS